MRNTAQVMGSPILHAGAVGLVFLQALARKTNQLPSEKVPISSLKGADCAGKGSGGFHTVCSEGKFGL